MGVPVFSFLAESCPCGSVSPSRKDLFGQLSLPASWDRERFISAFSGNRRLLTRFLRITRETPEPSPSIQTMLVFKSWGFPTPTSRLVTRGLTGLHVWKVM